MIALATSGADAGENDDADNEDVPILEPDGAPALFVVPSAAETVETKPLEAATRQIDITTTTMTLGNRNRDILQ